MAGATLCLWLTAHFSAQQSSWKPSTSLGLPDDAWYFVPKNNPITPAKTELGRKLFFDARSSDEGRISCSSWHDPKLAFTDGREVSEGAGGRLGPRNTPNAMFDTALSAHNPAQASLASAQQSSLERSVAETQRILASDLDAELPKISVAEWFGKIVGPEAGIVWQLGECGERGEDSLRATGDIPACVEANALLPDGRKVILLYTVGTFKKGKTGSPAFHFGVIDQAGNLHTIRRLRDLQKQLLAPGGLANRHPVTLPEVNTAEVRLPTNDEHMVLAPAWGWDAFGRATAIEEPPPAPQPRPEPASTAPAPAVAERGVSEGSQGSVITKAEPTYPKGAEKFNASGPVEVQVTISETGRVKNAVAISGHLLLRDAAAQAARRWVFTPMTVNGVPVETQIVLTFDFTVHK